MLRSKFNSVLQNVRQISTTSALLNQRLRRSWIKSMPVKDEGIQGVGSVDPAPTVLSLVDETTFNTLFNGIRFKDLPIIHVRCSMNNTLCTLCQSNGTVVATRSGGTEGFKHTKKGTTVAAQAAATALAYRAFRFSMKDVRLVIKGLGPGRLASVKALQLTGINIVSITDRTPSPLCPLRPRKARRV